MSNGIGPPIAYWSPNYLSTEYCVLSPESLGHFAIPTTDARRLRVPAPTHDQRGEGLR